MRAARSPGWARTTAQVGLVAGTVAVGLWAHWQWLPGDGFVDVFDIAIAVAFVVTGLVMRPEPAQRRNGTLFIAMGLLWLGNTVNLRVTGPLPAIGWAVTPLDEMVLLVVLMRYPADRIADRLTRRIVVLTVAAVLTPYYLAGLVWDPYTDGWDRTFWWPTVYSANDVVHGFIETYFVTALLAAAAVVVLVGRRYVLTRGLGRRELFPVLLAAVAVALAYVARGVLQLMRGTEDVGWPLELASNLVVLMIPVAFAATALRRRLDRSAVADLVLAIPQPATVGSVRDALRRVLIDPSLEVYVWLAERATYTDGTDVLDTLDGAGRLRRDVTDARGGQLAVVLLDPTLERRADLVDAAVRAAALNLENARLHAELVAQLQELAQSRTRIVEAGVAQRRQVERDLHDGAQQRLLALAATIGRARTAAAADPAVQALMEQARGELRQALKELRDLARGIHPAVLEQVGLGAAVETVAESMPLPVNVTVDTGRLPAAVESTAYFVICEALTNVVKHAAATRADVTVQRRDGTVRLTVADDGTGGASAATGGGLAGLTDRVAALGGTLHVDSPAGAGTRLTVELPCAS
ncbi:ATP-binding protein [Dactylosporangium sp. NPDC049525]|uniref:sensor histidine kinase n=1 Tax=Dactylosporangium sp. NPDC049525 TaxID=3154730 RepID=UPI00343F1A83